MSDSEAKRDRWYRSWFAHLSRFFSAEPGNREDVITFLRAAEGRELIDAEALSIMEGALQVSDMQVREIMVPRSQMVVLKVDLDPQDMLRRVAESGHSRFPVVGEDADDVLGILLAKDLLALARADTGKFNVKDHLRPTSAVPESKRLNVLLQDFRQNRNHLAIVYDEHGGVAGIVTIEDVLEQIVGDIEDEFDYIEEGHIYCHADGSYTIKALTSIEDFNEHFGCSFESEEATIGGLVTRYFGYLPERNEQVAIDDFKFTVLSSDGRRIRLLRLEQPRAASAVAADD